jgi:hypothetical protein
MHLPRSLNVATAFLLFAAAPFVSSIAQADRIAAEAPGSTPGSAGIRVITGFECALQHPVRFISGSGTPDDPTHFSIRFPNGRQQAGYFLFRLDNVANKSIRIDFHTDRARNWTTLNPVYAWVPADRTGEASDELLADPTFFLARETPVPNNDFAQLPRAPNGPRLPITRIESPRPRTAPGTAPREFQAWHFIPQGSVDEKQTFFRLEHTFTPAPGSAGSPAPGNPAGLARQGGAEPTATPSSVFIAMKYPYTLGLHERLMDDLAARISERRLPFVEILSIGESAEGRPLQVVKIATGTDAAIRRKPTVLIYAREHPDEHDTSWVTHGAIELLMGGHPDARAIRERCVFLIIPVLDPDGVGGNIYENMIRTFNTTWRTPESLAWAEFARQWVDAGNRLDLVINLHNVESAEMPHLLAPLMYPQRGPLAGRHDACWVFHRRYVTPEFRDMGFEVARETWGEGLSRFRFGGWLSDWYGTLHMPYEVNSQAPTRHLSLYELQTMGALMVRASVRFLHSPDAQPVVRQINAIRRERQRLVERYSGMPHMRRRDAFSYEVNLRHLQLIERSFAEPGETPAWLEPAPRTAGGRSRPTHPTDR